MAFRVSRVRLRSFQFADAFIWVGERLSPQASALEEAGHAVTPAWLVKTSTRGVQASAKILQEHVRKCSARRRWVGYVGMSSLWLDKDNGRMFGPWSILVLCRTAQSQELHLDPSVARPGTDCTSMRNFSKSVPKQGTLQALIYVHQPSKQQLLESSCR